MELCIHIPKNVRYTPLSLQNLEGYDDDNDFLQDPDQLCDLLPQPYRMVNKLVDDLFCDTWEIIKDKEERDFANRNKVRPPKYDCSVACDLGGRGPTCLTASADGMYIFVCIKEQLLAINAATNAILSHIDNAGVDITSMKCALMSPSIHIICTIDDLGVARIFAFTCKRFYVMKSFAEQDVTVKVLATACDTSPTADYVGLVQEYSSTGESQLDVYKLPTDVWAKELEALLVQLQKQKVQHMQASTAPPSLSDAQSATIQDIDDIDLSALAPSDQANLIGMERAFKFTPPTLVIKIRAPPKPTACTSNNIASMCKAIDSGDVIGQGTSHVFTQYHVDQRKNMFNYLHRDLLDYIPSEKEDGICRPTFHFLRQGRMTVSVDPTIPEDGTASVLAWWTGSRFLYHYSLIKFPAKDLEQKPDLVVPLSHAVICSATSPCSSLLALALNNGSIVLWDRSTGIEKGVVDLGKEHTINSMQFINRGACGPDDATDLGQSARVMVLVLSHQSLVHLVSFGSGSGHITVTEVCDSLRGDNAQRITSLQPLPRLQQIVLRVERNGVLYLQDIISQSVLCELALPHTHELSSPWQPAVALGDGGHLLYLNGASLMKSSSELIDQDHTSTTEDGQARLASSTQASQDATVEDSRQTPADPRPSTTTDPPSVTGQVSLDTTDRLFAFQLRSFPCLDDYWADPPAALGFTRHYTAVQRVDAYMKQRLGEQGERKARMQTRWAQFKQDLITRALSVDMTTLKKTLSTRTQSTDFLPKIGTDTSENRS